MQKSPNLVGPMIHFACRELQRDHVFPVHQHVDHELLWNVAGTLRVRWGDRHLDASGRVGVLIPPGFPHDAVATKGTSFNERRQQVRTDIARRLLADGVPSGVVASNLGYRDPGSFSRAFRLATGTTPSQANRDRALADARQHVLGEDGWTLAHPGPNN